MTRKIFLCTLLLGCFTSLLFGDESVKLTADVLQKVLYAKTAEEKAYCTDIINQRNAGKISDRVLYAVYRKAASQEKTHRLEYFKRAIKLVK